jgi:outer membrane receptor protein involved in Fe transport
VRQVSIRGVGSALNSVTMDGQQVASAQSAGTGRQFEFEQASLGNIETIEVTKAPTPDMDGASIGGSVNLVTKSAFDRAPGRIFNYTVASSRSSTAPTRNLKQPVADMVPR